MYEYKAEIVNIVDGDTLSVIVDLGFNIRQKIRVRLARVNTPEIHGVLKDSVEYQNGIASKKFVEDFARMTNNKVRIVTNKDKAEIFGRYIAEIYAEEGAFVGQNLNDELLTNGFAVLYEKTN